MGTKMAPSFAGLFMANLECPFLDSCVYKPSVYKRYIDDIFILWEHGETSLNQFLTKLNTTHPTIKFTWEYNHQSITFLDVDIYKQTHSDGTPMLAYRTHFKETNSFQYVHFRSFHPKATKKGIDKGELTIIKNTTSDDAKASETLDFISNKFRERSYPQSIVDQARQSLTSASTRRPLSSMHINSIVRHTWKTTITEQSLLNLFPTPPMVVYTRQRNLANFLCRSGSPGEGTPTTTLPAPPLPKRVHPCGHAQCKCCTQLLQTHNLHGHPLTQHLNCRPKNEVYLIRRRQLDRSTRD